MRGMTYIAGESEKKYIKKAWVVSFLSSWLDVASPVHSFFSFILCPYLHTVKTETMSYNRPSAPPPGYGGYQQQYSRPSGPPPQQYSRPSGAPPQQFSRPSGPPPNMRGVNGGNYNMQSSQIPGTNIVQNFQLSSCTGKRKALLIGINYIGTQNALRGCINDSRAMQKFLLQNNYNEGDMVILNDDSRNPVSMPTRNNIIRAMEWLVKDAQAGDSLFFHYSGHGGEEKDEDGDEVDGKDECIYPVDFQTAGSIVDDVMHEIMVKRLPAGCRLTALFDSCHSGTVLDLPFTYRAQDGGIKEYNIWKDSAGDGLNIFMGYATKNTSLMLSGAKALFNKAVNYKSKDKLEKIQREKMSNADIIMFSGCRDDQTSADANEAGTFTGAMSYAFLTAMAKLHQGQQYTYLSLLQSLRSVMSEKYTQKPQLSSSHQIDPNSTFMF